MSITQPLNGRLAWSIVSMAINGLVGLLLIMLGYMLSTQEARIQNLEISAATERYSNSEFRGKADRWLLEQDRRLQEIGDELRTDRKG